MSPVGPLPHGLRCLSPVLTSTRLFARRLQSTVHGVSVLPRCDGVIHARERLNCFAPRGGAVALHETAIIRPASEGKKLAQCLGMAWDEGRSQWGAIFEDISIKNEHEIFTGFPARLKLVDEFYWRLHKIDRVKILGTVRTGPPGHSRAPVPQDKLSKVPAPMFWTLESGAGRLFGTTTGHNTFTYYDPEFRIVLFRAMAWAMKEAPGPFLPLVFEGITDEDGMVGTTDTMRGWKGKLREAPRKRVGR